MIGRPKVLPLLLLLCTQVTAGALASQTRTWTATPADLQRGNLEGMAVSSKGRLFLSPDLERMGADPLPGEAAHVWSAIADRVGNVFLGTGPDGKVFKVAAGGGTKLLFSADEPMVTALALLPDGDLLAGTAPQGRIYRIGSDGRGVVWCETGQRYVWALATDRTGKRIFVGTGEEGLVLEIDAAGEARLLFDTDEPHVVTLEPMPDGSVLAGGGGRGLVYRIDLEGRAQVLHDDDLPEVRDLLLQPDGAVMAALLAPPASEPRPPAVRLHLPEGVDGRDPPENLTDLEEEASPTLQGVLEGLPPSPDVKMRGLRGRVVRIAPDGVVTEIWRSSTEAPFTLTSDASGDVFFGTGEPARLYRLDGDGDVALLGTLPQGQLTRLVHLAGDVAVATSNPAAIYRLRRDVGESGEFVSRPIDAGGIARWGRIGWTVSGPGSGPDAFTRTGNSAQPDATWSPWGPPLRDSSGSGIQSPEGRFLQWRMRLSGSSTQVSTVAVSYAPRNRPPTFREFRLDKSAITTVSSDVTFRWVVADADGDPLDVEIQYRPAGTTAWRSAARTTASDPEGIAGSASGEARREGRTVWDATSVPEGDYEIRGMASDQPANRPGEGRSVGADSTLRLQVDRTPPEIELRKEQDGALEVTVTDGTSSADRLEILSSGQVLWVAPPVDGVNDSRTEVYRIAAPKEGDPGGRVLRAVDAAGNATERPLQAR